MMRRRTLLSLLVFSLSAPSPGTGQFLEACDTSHPEICASVEFTTSGTDLWVHAEPTGRSAAVTGLRLTIPGIFESQVSQEVPWSISPWWFTLSGGMASHGNFSPYLTGSADAFGIAPYGLFHFALSAPLRTGLFAMEFAALRLYNWELDGPLYRHDYVLGTGSAAITATPTSVAPEPMSLALLGTGLAGLALFGLRRRKQAV